MANFSNYLEDHIINKMLRNQEFAPPANIYLALFTSNTNLETNAPPDEVDVEANCNYTRKECWLNAASAGGNVGMNADVTFNEANANWGTVTALAIVDHATGDDWGTNVNVLMWGDLTVAKTVDDGDTFKIPAADLVVSVE